MITEAKDVKEFFERVASDWDAMRLAYYDERVIELDRADYSVTAIDPRAPEGPIFRRVGIEEFSEPGPFDHVVAILSLHHVEDISGALDKIVSLLRAGGTLVVVEFAWDLIDKASWAASSRPLADGLQYGCGKARLGRSALPHVLPAK